MFPKQFIGMFIVVCIFFITIPTILYKHKYYNFLEVYLPNVDLLSNIITFHNGIGSEYTDELYLPNPFNFYNKTTKMFINYCALLGVTYLISRETKTTNSIYKGWSLGFIMLFLTYLFPSTYIFNQMTRYSNMIPNEYKKYKNWFGLLVGVIITSIIIYIEKNIIHTFRNQLINISKNIISFPSSF